MAKYSVGRVVAGSVLAVLCVLTLPYTLIFSSVFLVTPVALALLWAWAGPVAGALLAAGTLVFTYMGMPIALYYAGMPIVATLFERGNLAAMGAVGAALLASGLAMVYILHRRPPFFRGIALSVGVQLALVIAVLGAARYAAGRDVVDALIDGLYATVDELPPLSVNQFLLQLGRLGQFGTSTGIDFNRVFLTEEERQMLVNTLFQSLSSRLKRELPVLLINSCLMTGLVGYSLSARVRVRRGDEPAVPFAHLHNWRLTPGMVVGLPACMLVSYAAFSFGMAGADSVYLVVSSLTETAFIIQGLGAAARVLRRTGMSPGKRLAMYVLLAVVAQFILLYAGIYSALLGSRGLIALYMKKRALRRGGKGDN